MNRCMFVCVYTLAVRTYIRGSPEANSMANVHRCRATRWDF